MGYNLEADYKYFLDNLKQLSKKYEGKFVVIKNKEVIAAYDDEVTAFNETTKENEPGTFIIQQASLGSAEAQVFHSRVISK